MKRALLIGLLVLAAPVLARAEAVDFQVFSKVLAGSRDKPSIQIVANDDADGVEVVLKRDDGKSFKHRTGPMRAGSSKSFPIQLAAGKRSHYTASMTVTANGESRSADFEFDAEIVQPAQLSLDKSRVDLSGHALELVSTRPTAKVEIEVTSDEGEQLGHTEVPFDEPQPAGTPMRVSWTQSAGTAMKITVRAHDPDGFYYGVELYPWRIEIPHEEVSFATNSFTIDKSEEPKLDRSLQQISDAVSRYGRWADIKLFIGGHTDTVGDSASNRTLSFNRARAISQYFARRGVKVPILYAGFGEDALKVATPDETDEPRNRRAEYIVAIEAPEARGGVEWKRLR